MKIQKTKVHVKFEIPLSGFSPESFRQFILDSKVKLIECLEKDTTLSVTIEINV